MILNREQHRQTENITRKKNVVLTYRLRNQYDEDADDADDELCLLDD